jgi:hypothetical protein
MVCDWLQADTMTDVLLPVVMRAIASTKPRGSLMIVLF